MPLAAALQTAQGGDSSVVGAVSASTEAFQAAHGQFALVAANLLAVGEERLGYHSRGEFRNGEHFSSPLSEGM